MDRGVWPATVHRVQSQTQLSDQHFHFYFTYKSDLISRGTSLVVQRLRLCTSIPGGATKIPHATQHSQKKLITNQLRVSTVMTCWY